MLFSGSQELERLWLEGIAAAPADASPLAVVTAGLDPVAEMFAERHDFARIRAGIIEANPELQERELIKLQNLAGAIKAALRRARRLGERGDPGRPVGRDGLSRGLRPLGGAGRPDRLQATDGRVAGRAAVGDRRVGECGRRRMPRRAKPLESPRRSQVAGRSGFLVIPTSLLGSATRVAYH